MFDVAEEEWLLPDMLQQVSEFIVSFTKDVYEEFEEISREAAWDVSTQTPVVAKISKRELITWLTKLSAFFSEAALRNKTVVLSL